MKRSMFRLCIVIALLAVAFPSGAQEVNDTKVSLARRLFNEGVKAAHQRQWEQSYDRFSRSNELAPGLLTLFNLAAAPLNTGRLVEANESYRQFLRETNDGRYDEYRDDANRAVAALDRRIAYARIEIAGLTPNDEVVLDRNRFPHAVLGEALPLNPGPHTLAVRRSGQIMAERSFKIREGDSETIKIRVDFPTTALTPPPAGNDWVEKKAPHPSERDEKTGLFRSPWFWGAITVMAGSAGGYLFLRERDSEPSPGTLGRGVIEF